MALVDEGELSWSEGECERAYFAAFIADGQYGYNLAGRIEDPTSGISRCSRHLKQIQFDTVLVLDFLENADAIYIATATRIAPHMDNLIW